MFSSNYIRYTISMKFKAACGIFRMKLNAATSFNPDLYDLLSSHAQRLSPLGRTANFTLKVGHFTLKIFKHLRYLNSARLTKPLPVVMDPQDIDAFPWLKQLTAISANKGQRILIIAEVEIPQCYMYRVRQKVNMFEFLGYEVTVCRWNEISQVRLYLQNHALVIFYRVPAFEEVKILLKECERLGLDTFFDVDDLIFDLKEYAQNSNIASLPEKEKEELFKGCELYRYTLEHCRHAIANTPVIAKFMKKYCNGDIYIVENCIDKQMFSIVQNLGKDFLIKDRNYIVIGYGSGTTTHDVDFQQCASTILRVLTTYPQVRLAVHGHLQLPSDYEGVQSQILRVPFLNIDDYFRALATFDINLSPLENTLFNDAKSNIKFIEASMFAIPTIASPCATFKQVITHGKNGFLCTSPDEWLSALSVLIEDESQRIEIGKNARGNVFKQYDYKHVANKKLLPLVNKYLPPTKKKKRILIVNVLFSPIAFGGATIVTEELARLINQNQEMEVTIFTGFWDDGGGGIPYEEVVRYEALGMPVIAVRFPKEMSQKLDYLNTNIAQQFYHVLKSIQPDIVHFHSVQQLGASMAKSCLELNIPYIITLHDAWWLCERQFMVRSDGIYCGQCPVDPRVCVNDCTTDSAYTYARYYYLRNILMNAAVLLTPSDFQKEFYVSNGFKESHIKVNKNGVLPPSSQFEIKKNTETRFAYLGGNAQHKGYNWLAKIFESIELTAYSLCLVDCQRKIGSPSIYASDWPIGGELIISDGFDQTSIDDFFSNIDVLLFPSQWKESFGLTVREALIRDVWVIVTDSGGTVEDIISGVNGQIFDRNDTRGFRQAIVDAIEKRRDFINPHKEEIRLFSEQAQELVDIYNVFI